MSQSLFYHPRNVRRFRKMYLAVGTFFLVLGFFGFFAEVNPARVGADAALWYTTLIQVAAIATFWMGYRVVRFAQGERLKFFSIS